ARQAFNQACAKSAACRSVAGVHGAWARIGQLARRLTRAPVTGETVSPDGTLTKLTVTVETLVNLVNNAGFDPVVYRDLDRPRTAATPGPGAVAQARRAVARLRQLELPAARIQRRALLRCS